MSTLQLPPAVLAAINAHGERAYPNESCGFLLGRVTPTGARTVVAALALANRREAAEQYHRFLIAPADTLWGEAEAAARGLDLLGVYHSHPDHPARPSEFDRAHALPWWSYVITTVANGQAGPSRAWRLRDDRSAYEEDQILP